MFIAQEPCELAIVQGSLLHSKHGKRDFKSQVSINQSMARNLFWASKLAVGGNERLQGSRWRGLSCHVEVGIRLAKGGLAQ